MSSAPKGPRLPRRPRIRISRQRRGSGRWRGWLAGTAGLSLLLGAGLWIGDQLRQQPPSVDLEHSLEVLRADLQREIEARRQAEAAWRRIEQRLLFKTAEVEAFAADVKRQETELAFLREELAFYERLADGFDDTALGIRALQLQRTGEAGVFEASFQLYRPGLNRPVTVEWQLRLEGRQPEEDQVTVLSGDELGLDAERTVQDFRLLRTQQVRIRLPRGFRPIRLTLVAAAENNDDSQSARVVADWDRLLEGTQ